MATYWQVVCTDQFAVFCHDVCGRHLRLILRLNDDDFAQTGRFIRLYLISHVFNNAFKFNLTGSFGNDNRVERVPTGNHLAFLYHFTIGCIERRTVGYIMSGKHNTCVDIHETHFGQTAYHYLCRFACFVDNVYRTEFFEFQTGRILGHDACVGSNIGCRTTGMECTQCQLCTRLTDRLCSNYADCLTFLNHAAGSQITSVTLGTNTLLGFAGQYGTDFNTLNRGIFNLLRNVFGNFLTASHNQFASCRMNNIMYGYTTEDAFIQSGDGFVIVFQCCTNQSAERAAVFFINNHIVRYVNQTTGQVSGVSRLQSGIGKTLTGTVSRDKVFQHGQTFLKVRKNRIFNNLTAFGTCFLGLCHQTTHTGELTDLFLRTTGTGIQHHVYRVETLVVA